MAARAGQNDDDRSSRSSSCFSSSQRNRVRPLSPVSGENHQVEIRPGRILHIRHINARPRDYRFEKEMGMQRMYKSQGLQTSGGPLSMPKNKTAMKTVTKTDAHTSSALPNSVDHNGMMNSDKPEAGTSSSKVIFASTPSGGHQDIVSTSSSLPEASEKRQISASGAKALFASPSSVLVDMQASTITENGTSVSDPNTKPEGVKAESEDTMCTAISKAMNKTDSDLAVDNIHSDAAKNTPVNQNNSKTASNNNSTDASVSTSQDKPPLHPSVQKITDNQVGKEHSGLSETELAALCITAANNAPASVQAGKSFSSLEGKTPQASPAHNSVPNPGTKPPSTVLFFFHGVGGSSSVWQAQMKYFAKEGYEIVAPDLIGHGLSCTPKNAKAYHFTEIAADSEEIFDKYCKKRNVIIGHSYGCSFAVVLARKRSRRVHKLVLISGGSPTPLAPQPGIFTLPKCLLGCMRPCLNCGFHKNAFHRDRQPVIDKAEAFSIPTYVLQHTMNGQDWADGDELYHQWLLCPTLLLYGAQDKLVTLKEEEHMEETIYRSRLEVIPDASHMVMIEAPDEVCHLLHTFLTEDSTLCTKSNSPQPPVQPEISQSPMRPVSRMSLKSTKSYKAHLI